jgi:hypothetical protein
LVQPKSTIAITPSFVFTMEDSRVDVRLEEIEAIVMEKYVENVIMNM